MMRFELKGKAALVTGAASGMGLATATLLGRFGCAVAMNYLPDDARGPDAIKRLRGAGYRVIPAPADVSVVGEPERMVGAKAFASERVREMSAAFDAQ